MSELAPPPVGTVLDGRYRLERVIGTGGVGVVYEAEDLAERRRVGVKVLRTQLLAGGPFVERLRREARAIESLRHPNVVRVFSISVEPTQAFFVMELLEGQSFGALLRDAPPLTEKDVAIIGRGIFEALAAAHDAGMVHRDVKPDNVFLAKEAGATVVKLLDFGLVKSASETPLTATGTVLGTFQYMPPEQAQGLPVDGRADVYAACASLYYALVRKRPYQAADMEASMFALSEIAAPPLRKFRPELDPDFCQLIERGLAKTPAARPTAREMLAALAPFAAASPSITRIAAPPATPTVISTEPTTERKPAAPEDSITKPFTPPDHTEPLANPPVAPPRPVVEEIVAPRTVPLAAPPPAATVRRKDDRKRAGLDVRVTIFAVVALLFFVVGVLVGRAFIFK